MRFWDTSALAPLFLAESWTAIAFRLRQEDELIAAWWGSRVECTSALTRALREGRLDASSLAAARTRLQELFSKIDEIVPTENVRERAERLLAVHSLRAADALQLAAALIWSRERPQGFEFVSFDNRLRESARREGFTVLPIGVAQASP